MRKSPVFDFDRTPGTLFIQSSRWDSEKCRLFYRVHFENDDANGETRVCQLCPDLRVPIKSASTSHDCTPHDRIASLRRTDIVYALPCSGYIARHGREQQQSPTPGATANRHRRRPGEEAAFPRKLQIASRSPIMCFPAVSKLVLLAVLAVAAVRVLGYSVCSDCSGAWADQGCCQAAEREQQ